MDKAERMLLAIRRRRRAVLHARRAAESAWMSNCLPNVVTIRGRWFRDQNGNPTRLITSQEHAE